VAREADDADDAVDLDHPGGPLQLQHLDEARAAAASPEERRPPQRRPMGHRRTTTLLAVLVAGLLTVAALRDTGEDPPDGPPLDGSATAEELFPLLAEPPAGGAVPPAGPLAEAPRLVPGSARPLGTTATTALWVARDDRGGVCLLTFTAPEGRGLGGTCGSAEKVAARGLRTPASGGTAVLVPSGFDTTALRQDGDVELAPHLWVDAGTAEDAARALVAAAAGSVVVTAEGRTGDDALPTLLTQDGATYALAVACLTPGTVRVSADGGDPQQLPCSRDVNSLRFTGDGGPVRVVVDAPERLVWAGGVVACTGPRIGPVC
jgi:hypothetical protein